MKKQFILISSILLASFSLISQVSAQIRNRPDFFEQGTEQFEQEIQNLQQSAPDNAVSPLTVNDGSLQWYQVLLKEAKCSIWMPEGVVSQDTENIAFSNENIKFNLLASNPKSARFLVAYSEEISDTSLKSPELLLNEVKQILDNLKSKETLFTLSEEKDNTINGYPSKDFTLKSNEETISVRLILVDKRLYVLGVNQLTEGASLKVVSTFFQSFQLIK